MRMTHSALEKTYGNVRRHARCEDERENSRVRDVEVDDLIAVGHGQAGRVDWAAG